MKKKRLKRAHKKKVHNPPLAIEIKFKQKPTLQEIEQAINRKLATRATDLFRTSQEVVIIVKESTPL